MNRQKISKTLASIWRRLRKIKLRYIAGGFATTGVAVLVISLLPQQTMFSYQGSTCILQPHLAPGLLTAESAEFKATPSQEAKIGDFTTGAREVCFEAISAPKPGKYVVPVYLPWMPYLKKEVTVTVPSYPRVSATQLDKPLPLSEQLVFTLDKTDDTFIYRLIANDKHTDCTPHELSIRCDIGQLALQQGSAYTLRLERLFEGKKIATVIKKTIKTLPAVKLLDSSIKNKEMVYAKPRTLNLRFDKPVNILEVELTRISGEDKRLIPVSIQTNEQSATISWNVELERQSVFEVKLKHVVASDGSRLASPTTLSFTTSGGPRVTGIDVGTYKVPVGAQATISFDQPLAPSQNLSRLITASGGARITGYSGNRVWVSFAGVPRCSGVTIRVADELSSNHGVSGGSAWQFSTRTICQIVTSIGTSVKGRSILAYTFGSGSKFIVFTGAIHGDESSTRSLMLRWIDSLEANIHRVPSDKRVVVIPTVNPDGYAAGTRTNANNVDLNRNFDTADWQKDITTVDNKPFPGGGGVSPLSEPESAALASYIAVVRPTAVFSYHSIGAVVAANQVGNSFQFAQKYASQSGYSNVTGSSTTFEYAVTGTADDYYGQHLGLASVLIELGSHTYHQFEQNKQAMWTMLNL